MPTAPRGTTQASLCGRQGDRCYADAGVVRGYLDQNLRDRAPQLLSLAINLHGAALRAKLGRMAPPITVSIPHQLGRAEARRRIETGFAKIIQLLPGGVGNCNERWDGDRLIFDVAAMGQTVAGVINVLDKAVTMEIELPGMLGTIASGLKDRLQTAGQMLLTKK